MRANHKAIAAPISAIARLQGRHTAESASGAPITTTVVAPPLNVSPTCEAHTKSTASRRQIIAQAKGHSKIATGPKRRAGITGGVNDAVMAAFAMVSDLAP